MQECKNVLMSRRAPCACVHARVLALLLVLLAHAPETLAQPADAVGVRAQGMSGAFTAVADDATATWWNPAGLAAGPYANAILEAGQVREPPAPSSGDPAWRTGQVSVTAAFPALGLSYYRLRISEIAPTGPTAAAAGGRQDPGTGDVRLRSMILSQFGATVGQSLGEHLVVASTLKLLHGDLATAVRPAEGATLDSADALGGAGDTRGTFDVGAMTTYGVARAGVTVRNVTAPTFGSGADALTLRRQVRGGFALTTVSSSFGGWTLAVDADLTRAATPDGDERRIASGVEAWTHTRRVGARAGVSASTFGAHRAAASAGGSWAVRSGLYVDAQVTGGTRNSRRGWGFDTRVTF